MSAVFEQPTLWQRLRPLFGGFDATLTLLRPCWPRPG